MCLTKIETTPVGSRTVDCHKQKDLDIFIDGQIACEDALHETLNSSQSESDLLLPPLLPPKINPGTESLIPKFSHFSFKNHLKTQLHQTFTTYFISIKLPGRPAVKRYPTHLMVPQFFGDHGREKVTTSPSWCLPLA
jgi:hypothetical protein